MDIRHFEAQTLSMKLSHPYSHLSICDMYSHDQKVNLQQMVFFVKEKKDLPIDF